MAKKEQVASSFAPDDLSEPEHVEPPPRKETPPAAPASDKYVILHGRVTVVISGERFDHELGSVVSLPPDLATELIAAGAVAVAT